MIRFMLAELTAVALIVGFSETAKGADLDTIRAYDPQTPRRYITASRYVRQLQRFSVLNGTVLHSIRIQLAGKPKLNAGKLRIFGDEGGLIVPRLRNQLTDEIQFHKSVSGREWVTIELNRPLTIAGNQFFVEVELTDSHLRLLSDSKIRVARCMESVGLPRVDQLHVNPGDSSWTETPFAYYVEIEVESPLVSEGLVLDTLFRASDVSLDPHSQPLSCGDVNDDGLLEIAATSQLHINQGGQFQSLNCDDGSGPSYLFFWDADADGVSDLAAMRLNKASEVRLFRYINGGLQLMRTISLLGECTPSGMLQSDLDNDGLTEVILTSKSSSGHGAQVLSSQPVAVEITGPMAEYVANAESLVLTGLGGRNGQVNKVLCRSESGITSFTLAATAAGWSSSVGYEHANPRDASGSDEYVHAVSSVDDTIRTTLLYPTKVPWKEIEGLELSATEPLLPLTTSDLGSPHIMRQGWWMDKQGSILQTDLDNDNRRDFIAFQSNGCGLIRVYSEVDHGYIETTGLWGLADVSNCTNGICADFDADGRQDLVLLVNGQPHLFRNRRSVPLTHAVRLRPGAHGTASEVHGSQTRKPVRAYSGRDRLIQDPSTIYLLRDDIGDSVNVRWSDGKSESFAVEPSSKSQLLVEGKGAANGYRARAVLNCSASQVDGSVVIDGLMPGVENTISVRSIAGVTVASLTTSDRQAVLVLGNVASGNYLISVVSADAVCSTSITIVQ